MRYAASCALLALLCACQKEESHPPYLSSCEPGKHCPVSVGIGTFGGPTPPDPGGGEGGESGAATDLTGTIVELVDDGFETATRYDASAIVEGQRPNDSVVSTVVLADEPFLLEGIESSRATWVSLRPQTGSRNLRTLHPVATNQRQVVTLSLVRTDTFDLIFSQLTTTPERSENAGQIVLRFIEEVSSGVTQSVSGVRVSAARTAFVAYKSGEIWSDVELATDDSGLALLGNVTAQAYPGATVRLTLGGSASGSVDVRVASGGVSLVEIPLSP